VDLHFERALFAGAHLDDVEFGCGGAIAKWAGERDVRFLTLTKKTRDSAGQVQIVRDLDEPVQAAKILGIPSERVGIEDLDGQVLQYQAQAVREVFLKWRRDFDPDVVFVPAANDVHQDHHVVYEEAVRIFRERTVIGFEVVRSTLAFRPNLFVEIDADQLDKKVRSILCYRSQLEQSAGYYFKADIIEGQARFRGGQCGRELAEAFEVYCMQWS
jgi:LmbE family N-acetylglucosaminyl deacetylase